MLDRRLHTLRRNNSPNCQLVEIQLSGLMKFKEDSGVHQIQNES